MLVDSAGLLPCHGWDMCYRYIIAALACCSVDIWMMYMGFAIMAGYITFVAMLAN